MQETANTDIIPSSIVKAPSFIHYFQHVMNSKIFAELSGMYGV